MSTPIEDRVLALEQWRTAVDLHLGDIDSKVSALESRSVSQGDLIAQQEQRIRTLEGQADRHMALIRRIMGIIRTLTEAVAPAIARFIDRHPEEERQEMARQWERVSSGGRFDPDNSR